MAPRKPKPQSQSDQIRAANEAPKAPAVDRKDDGIPKNNLQAMREAEGLGLVAHLAKLRPLVADVEAAQAIVKTKREAVAKQLDLGAAEGYPKGLVRKLLAETAVTGDRKNLREEWEREVRFREYVGLPAMTQTDLEARMPEAAKDETDWRGAGYAAGLRGDACDPKGAQVPDRFHQAWMEEWGTGQTKLALSLGRKPKPDLDVIQGGKAEAGGTALDAIAEAEPELVDQVLEDHGGEGNEPV